MRALRASNKCPLMVIGLVTVAISAGLARSEVVTDEKIPVDKTVMVNPCIPTDVATVTGDIHMVSSATVSESGNVSAKVSINFQGVKLTTLNGDVYQCNDTNEQTLQDKPLPFVESTETDTEFVKPGPNNNFILKVKFHITINAKGVVTAVVDSFGLDCKK
jgi:hypothetical protein